MRAIVLDTETTNSLDDPLTYDIGWAVIDLDTEKVMKTQSFVVAEIFFRKDLMENAYFAEKIPEYRAELKAKKTLALSLFKIRKILHKDCQTYGVKEIYAHNAIFDSRSCNTTQRYITSSRDRYFFPYNIRICDTLKMSREAFGKDPEYSSFCKKNNYLTKRGQNRFTAEILYRFITNNNEFIEEHKGLEDVLIEKEILFECRKRGVTNGVLWE